MERVRIQARLFPAAHAPWVCTKLLTLTAVQEFRIHRGVKHLTPAQCVIQALGGIRPAARLLGIKPQSVSRWSYPKDRKGSAGSLSPAIQRRALALAQSQGLDLTPTDLVIGRDVALVETEAA